MHWTHPTHYSGDRAGCPTGRPKQSVNCIVCVGVVIWVFFWSSNVLRICFTRLHHHTSINDARIATSARMCIHRIVCAFFVYCFFPSKQHNNIRHSTFPETIGLLFIGLWRCCLLWFANFRWLLFRVFRFAINENKIKYYCIWCNRVHCSCWPIFYFILIYWFVGFVWSFRVFSLGENKKKTHTHNQLSDSDLVIFSSGMLLRIWFLDTWHTSVCAWVGVCAT